MIKILNENDSIENMSDEQIQELYNVQKSRVNDLVQLQIELLVEKLYRYKDAITNEVINDVIPRYYFDNNDLVIVDKSDDFEDRIDEIKDILKLKNTTNDEIKDNINEIISKIITGE